LTQSENGTHENKRKALKRTRRVEESRRSYENEPSCARRLVNSKDSGRLEKKADAEAVNPRKEIQRLQENDAQWQVQTQKLNSDLGQMQTYTEQLQAALRDAESSTTELRNDMGHCKPGESKMSLIKQRLPERIADQAFLA
jgi:septal ring factor EnvC (AmiA/AmiB activator)